MIFVCPRWVGEEGRLLYKNDGSPGQKVKKILKV